MRISLIPALTFVLACSFWAICQELQPEPAPPKAEDQSEIQDLLNKLQQDPNSAHLHNQLAVVYGSTGNLVGFEKEIGAAIKLQPKNPINYFQSSLVYGQNGRQQRQIAMLDKAIALDLLNPVLWFERARIYEVKGTRSSAEQYYLKAGRLLKVAEDKGKMSGSDHVLRDDRIVNGIYYDSFNNAYSAENLERGIEKGLSRTRAQPK